MFCTYEHTVLNIYIYTVLKGTKSLLQAVARENGVNFIDEEKDDENYQCPSFIYSLSLSHILEHYSVWVVWAAQGSSGKKWI